MSNAGWNGSIGAAVSVASNLVLNGGTLQYMGTGGSTDRQFTLGQSATSRLNSSGTGAIRFTRNAAISFSSPDTAQTIRLGGTNTDNNRSEESRVGKGGVRTCRHRWAGEHEKKKEQLKKTKRK